MIKINKDGSFTLQPDSDDVAECYSQLGQVADQYQPEEALYAVIYEMVTLAFSAPLRMDGSTLEQMIEIVCDDLANKIAPSAPEAA